MYQHRRCAGGPFGIGSFPDMASPCSSIASAGMAQINRAQAAGPSDGIAKAQGARAGVEPAACPLPAPATLRARRLGLHSQREPIVVLRSDSAICRSEGLAPHSRVELQADDRALIATLFQVNGDLLGCDDIGLSESSWQILGVSEGSAVHVKQAPPIASLASIRRRIYGHRLGLDDMTAIVRDVVAGRYADLHLAAFLTATAASPMDADECWALTEAMVASGHRLEWSSSVVVDKHCVGGLPGNRTTPIVVAIVAACGLTMPKTSSRAITSPAGTADVMATLAPVDLSIHQMRAVVDRVGGCIAWGGAIDLSPADDIFIGVERALDIDTEGQLVASVLSKKIAAGATHVVLDIPVGPTAKVRSVAAADELSRRLVLIAERFGIRAICVQSDGSQPVGRALGPALEAADVLAVLNGDPTAPPDLRARACSLAAILLEAGGAATRGTGRRLAERTLLSGKAARKFEEICDAQGGRRSLPVSRHRHDVVADYGGTVTAIDNRKIARLAKLAGAPDAPAAGLILHARVGTVLAEGDPLLTLHAESSGELAYALEYAQANRDVIAIGEAG